MALILDTGPVYASLDRNDAAHSRCRDLIESTTERLVIPAPVLVEVDFWIQQRLTLRDLLGFLDDISVEAYVIEDLIPIDYFRIRDLCQRYADSDIGFVDAAVLAVVERLGEPKLATLDHRRFGLLQPRHVDALLLLPDG